LKALVASVVCFKSAKDWTLQFHSLPLDVSVTCQCTDVRGYVNKDSSRSILAAKTCCAVQFYMISFWYAIRAELRSQVILILILILTLILHCTAEW